MCLIRSGACIMWDTRRPTCHTFLTDTYMPCSSSRHSQQCRRTHHNLGANIHLQRKHRPDFVIVAVNKGNVAHKEGQWHRGPTEGAKKWNLWMEQLCEQKNEPTRAFCKCNGCCVTSWSGLWYLMYLLWQLQLHLSSSSWLYNSVPVCCCYSHYITLQLHNSRVTSCPTTC